MDLQLHDAGRQAIVERLYETRGQYWNVHPDAAVFLQQLIEKYRPKRILELGASNGLSSIVMGDVAVQYGGEITSVEYFEERALLARENINEAGLTQIVAVVVGDALEMISSLDGPWDFVFLDVGKEDYIDCYLALKSKMNTGGILVADNMTSHTEQLSTFREEVISDVKAEEEELDVGEGLMVVRF